MEITVGSVKETHQLAKKIAAKISGGEVVCLYGNLGSGKTTFTQGLAKSLGVKGRVVSPTFILARRYPLAKTGYFYHVDLYRLDNLEAVKEIGIEEMWGTGNIVVIEWPEKIESILPKNNLKIKFQFVSEGVRKISLAADL